MKTLSVRFEESPDDEIVLRLSPVPTGELLRIMDLMSELLLTRESLAVLCEAFAPFVESWTYPEDIDADGLLARDFNQLYVVVNHWVREVRDAPPPLLLGSSGGAPSEGQATSPTPSPEPSSSTSS